MMPASIALEKKTASLRKLDDLLCRNGIEQVQAGIEAGKNARGAVANGLLWKTVAVEALADLYRDL
jgi:hypothetical protein